MYPWMNEHAVQELALLLARLKAGGSRALIFTQMSRMLDLLEVFLNLHAFTYLRLDGSTKPEQRQVCTLTASGACCMVGCLLSYPWLAGSCVWFSTCSCSKIVLQTRYIA